METLDAARPEDRQEIAALLRASGLPWQDIEAHLPHFTVAHEEGRLVGVIGLEVHGAEGLVRSLAVAADRRGRGIARRLYATLLARAQRLGLTRLYLLTTSAQGFFEMLGFHAVPRDAMSGTMQATEEFRTLCPKGAICLERSMPRP